MQTVCIICSQKAPVLSTKNLVHSPFFVSNGGETFIPESANGVGEGIFMTSSRFSISTTWRMKYPQSNPKSMGPYAGLHER